jgi:hypothetical protein
MPHRARVQRAVARPDRHSPRRGGRPRRCHGDRARSGVRFAQGGGAGPPR